MRRGLHLLAGRIDLADDRWPQCCYVYRIYGLRGELLYVGLTEHLRDRLRDHRSKPWGRHASHVEWDLWADRADAAREEVRLIRLHRPPYNVIDNEDDHYVLPRPRRTACGR